MTAAPARLGRPEDLRTAGPAWPAAGAVPAIWRGPQQPEAAASQVAESAAWGRVPEPEAAPADRPAPPVAEPRVPALQAEPPVAGRPDVVAPRARVRPALRAAHPDAVGQRAESPVAPEPAEPGSAVARRARPA